MHPSKQPILGNHAQSQLVSQHGPWTLSHFNVCVPLVEFECPVTFHVMVNGITPQTRRV